MENFDSKYGGCPMYYTISVLEGKWKWIILWEIYKAEIIRYNGLKNILKPIAHKTLSNQLKELENSNLIHRKQYNEIPPKVEYSLTEDGKTVIPILELMFKWGEQHIKDKSIHKAYSKNN